MHWIILFPINILLTIVCYLTNWIVVLFSDERGELHSIFKYWQTWDDSLDVEWFVKEVVPSIFRYDFDKHYISSREQTPELKLLNRDKGCVKVIDNNFSVKERIQRYFCRTLWLYRNNCYGFAFYLLGVNSSGKNLTYKWISEENDSYLCYDLTKNILIRPWSLKGKIWIFHYFFGWKLNHESNTESRSMIAGRIIFH